MKIVLGGIHTECSTYSPLVQTADDFRIVRGRALLEYCGLDGDRFQDVSFKPLFHARAIPGGPVAPDCYTGFKTAFLEELTAALPVDGVLLIMHGAMHVPGIEDTEGDWISAVRALVGQDVPIAVSYDLHGNVTQKIIDQIDIFCAYRTAPHIDVRQTHVRAAAQLVDQLRGGARRCVGWAPVPVLHPGERTSTEDEPARSLYRQLPDIDRQTGICDANLMIGYVWADSARATAAAVVTGTDRDAIGRAASDIAQGYWTARARFDFGVPAKTLDECLDDAASASTGPFVLADSGDNPTGGGVGDRTDVLHAWLARGLTEGVFAAIADPSAVKSAWNAVEGTPLSLRIGGSFGSPCPPVSAAAIVRKKLGEGTSADREVLVEIAGNLVILTERRKPFHDLSDFARFEIDPEKARFLIVKSGYLSPQLAPIANPSRMALTEGAVHQAISELSNTRRPFPCHPFQQDFQWHPAPHLSKRAYR
ncbi:M81 family metallopeptidase [Roseibium sp.]|uniref:M81 family metallopeptidase n=1 Tax=Roseibium sp. TaxID=1936156 RepID=UPI003262E843